MVTIKGRLVLIVADGCVATPVKLSTQITDFKTASCRDIDISI